MTQTQQLPLKRLCTFQYCRRYTNLWHCRWHRRSCCYSRSCCLLHTKPPLTMQLRRRTKSHNILNSDSMKMQKLSSKTSSKTLFKKAIKTNRNSEMQNFRNKHEGTEQINSPSNAKTKSLNFVNWKPCKCKLPYFFTPCITLRLL